MFKNMIAYAKLKWVDAKTNKQGALKSVEHEKKTLKRTIKLLAKDPMLESCWTRKGLLLFEDLYTGNMLGGARHALERKNPEAIRRAAIVLLGDIGDPDAKSRLFHIVRGTNEQGEMIETNEMREEAVKALGKIGGKIKGEERVLKFLMAVAREYKELDSDVVNESIDVANTFAH